MRPFLVIATLLLTLALSGCASNGTSSSRICPAGLTYSCTSAVGETQRCICASRDELRDILDPVNDY
jgi:hypothetical protein